MITKARKLASLLARPRFAAALARHRVAAATEHLHPIRLTAAASLLDVGANKGQFSLAFRTLRRDARIEAFEPLGEAADAYAALFAGDPRVRLHRVAVGAEEGTATFHVADRADSSSLLRPGAGQREAFGVGAAREIAVPVLPLGALVDVAAFPGPILMKIDVQGGELAVLQGFANLEAVDFIYVELSFVELYEGQPLFDEVAAFLHARGFALAGVFNQVSTPAFGPTQADFLFSRAGRG